MKHFFDNGTELPGLPDPYKGASPMTEERFVALGGTITDDGEPNPKEAVIASLNTLLLGLAEQIEGITIAEFKAAAQTMHSGDLIAYARAQGIDEEVIAEARSRIVEIMADALREGLSWAELIGGITP